MYFVWAGKEVVGFWLEANSPKKVGIAPGVSGSLIDYENALNNRDTETMEHEEGKKLESRDAEININTHTCTAFYECTPLFQPPSLGETSDGKTIDSRHMRIVTVWKDYLYTYIFIFLRAYSFCLCV